MTLQYVSLELEMTTTVQGSHRLLVHLSANRFLFVSIPEERVESGEWREERGERKEERTGEERRRREEGRGGEGRRGEEEEEEERGGEERRGEDRSRRGQERERTGAGEDRSRRTGAGAGEDGRWKGKVRASLPSSPSSGCSYGSHQNQTPN